MHQCTRNHPEVSASVETTIARMFPYASTEKIVTKKLFASEIFLKYLVNKIWLSKRNFFEGFLFVLFIFWFDQKKIIKVIFLLESYLVNKNWNLKLFYVLANCKTC